LAAYEFLSEQHIVDTVDYCLALSERLSAEHLVETLFRVKISKKKFYDVNFPVPDNRFYNRNEGIFKNNPLTIERRRK